MLHRSSQRQGHQPAPAARCAGLLPRRRHAGCAQYGPVSAQPGRPPAAREESHRSRRSRRVREREPAICRGGCADRSPPAIASRSSGRVLALSDPRTPARGNCDRQSSREVQRPSPRSQRVSTGGAAPPDRPGRTEDGSGAAVWHQQGDRLLLIATVLLLECALVVGMSTLLSCFRIGFRRRTLSRDGRGRRSK